MSHPAGVPRHAKLSNGLVRNRLPLAHAGQYVVRDSGKNSVAGFFVVVGKRAKTYTIQYDTRSLGRRRSHKEIIGRAEDWDADDARKEAYTGSAPSPQPDEPSPAVRRFREMLG